MDSRIQPDIWSRIIAGGAVVGLILIPLGYVIEAGLSGIGSFEFSHAILSRLWFTLWQSIVTVIISLGIGGGLAVFEHTAHIPPRRWFIGVMTLPIFMPSIVVALGFVAVWGSAGYINDVLQWLGGNRHSFLYSSSAVIASHVFYNIPLAYIAIRLRLRSSDTHLEDTARIMGASFWKRVISITLPRVQATSIGVGAIIFLYAFMSFALPLILGGIQYQTLEVYIYTLITQQYAFGTAAFVAILQLVLLSTIVLIGLRWIRDVQETRVALLDTQRSRSTGSVVITTVQILLSVCILLPIVAVLFRGITSDGWVLLFQSDFIVAWLRTAGVAILTVVLTLLLGISVMRLHNRWQTMAILILAVSPVTLGFAWRLLFGQNLWLLPLAYATLLLPVSLYSLRSIWAARPPDFINTIKILGGNTSHQLLATTRWLLPAGVHITTLTIPFVFGDIAIASILAPYNHPTAMVVAYQLVGSYRFSTAAAGMAVIIITVSIVIGLIFLLQHRYESRR